MRAGSRTRRRSPGGRRRPASATPRADDLLTGLRGKDVIIAFVESYGRVAVQGSAFSPQVDAVLDAGTSQLRAAGFSSRSAFLTSPTFGGISWLAHSTLQSGLWVDNQQRYDQLVASDRLTLSGAFKRAGWRTVADVPANDQDWPEGTSFYHYDQIYDARNVGYHGPDVQLRADARPVHPVRVPAPASSPSPTTPPVMAEIDLVSSHTPVGTAAAPGRLERGRRRLGLRPHARRRATRRTTCGATPTRCGPPTGSPSSTR